MVAAYFLRWDGPVTEYADPYPNPYNFLEANPVRHVQKVCWIPGKNDPLDNDGIKRAVMKYGAVQVAYYSSGGNESYNAATASYYCPYNHDTDHLVAIIGWDDDYPKENFATTPAGNGAFIVRNSWGTGWGHGGHFYVSYYDTTFGQYRMNAYSSECSDNYSYAYQYDTYGCNGNWGGWNSNAGWGANIFTAKDNDGIAAVGFYTFSANASYEIRVYTGCDADNPTSGTLAISQKGMLEEPG